MRVESNLIVKLVGNELRKARIPALTVHDCVIVKRQDAEQVEGIVKATGKE